MLTGKRISLAMLLSICAIGYAQGQYFNLGLSGIHDENIFDIYVPTLDRIVQMQLNASKDWDADELTFDLSYSGEFFFYRDLTARNYNVHGLSFNSVYQFYSDDEEPEMSDEDEEGEESSDSSQSAGLKNIPSVHVDSLDHLLTLNTFALAQFDGAEYVEYDNSHFGGIVSFRQPINTRASIRPAYMLAYNSYPNISGLTNFDQTISVWCGTSGFFKGAISGILTFGKKNYPTATSYTYDIESPGNSGHGKGGAGGGKSRTVTVDLTTPSVSQSVVSLQLKYPVTPTTTADLLYLYFGEPSSEARNVPFQLGGSGSQSDIFDDHYGYSGPHFSFQIKQQLPVNFSLNLQGTIQSKRYTSHAMDLQDSAIVAEHRSDQRQEYVVRLARPIFAELGKSLRAYLEYHYFNNESNAIYYEFKKNAYVIGLDFDF